MTYTGWVASFWALLVLSIAGQALATSPASATRTVVVRIALVGDSTTSGKGGWGGAFLDMLEQSPDGADVECINLSKGGTSSSSFCAEGRWAKCLDRKPDYILIQFGQNDQPGHGPDRE